MSDCFYKSDLRDFCDLMMLPDGTPIIPVDDEIEALCEDVLSRWYAEKDGEADVGRVLPSDYLWFTGDGKRNHFRNAYRGGQIWDWSLPTPYES